MTTNSVSLESLLEEWNEGSLSRASSAWLLLCCAPLYEPEVLLNNIPVELRTWFVREVERFPLGGGSFMVADRLEAPPEETVAKLRKVLEGRPGYLDGL